MATCLCVGATDLTTKDCGNYTIDVPSDASFEEEAFVPAGTAISLGGDGTSLSYSNDAIIEAETDKKNDLEIYYLDFETYGGSYSSVEEFKNTTLEFGAEKQDTSGDYEVYKNSDGSDYDYQIIVQKKGFLSLSNEEKIVVIEGNDLDLLTKMADSVKFK